MNNFQRFQNYLALSSCPDSHKRNRESHRHFDVKERHKAFRGASEIMGRAAGTAGIIDARFPGTHLGPN